MHFKHFVVVAGYYRPSLVSQYLAKDNRSVKDKISLSNHEMVTVPER